MIISYNWLKNLVDTKLSVQQLKEKLTNVGLAVEAIHEVGDDFVFDIDLTSNRPDCLSHLGVAREVAAIEKSKVKSQKSKVKSVEGKADDVTGVEILDADLCWRYAGRVVCGVKISASPEWLVKRLEAVGERSINNVADITNYVMHEFGQPLHAFDLDRLAEQRIVVRRARKGEKMKTLDGVERNFDEEMLLICDAEKPVAIAGIMGGEESGISDDTVNVLIESAYFLPSSVRKTSRALGLSSEASYRFERGTDIEGVIRAQSRCVELICEIAGGVATEDAIDVYPTKRPETIISLRPERVTALTGLKVEREEIKRILNALGFVLKEENGALAFVSPSWRHDMEREEDLVEEIARHYGYDKIEYHLPPSESAGEYQPFEAKERALRVALSHLGFDEAINYSFIDTSHDESFEFIPEFVLDIDEKFVTLQDSIIEGATRMRASLLPGLLGAVRHNFNHGTRDVRLFELGKVFAAIGDGELPNEREAFAMVITGGATEENKSAPARELDFYDLKGAFELAVAAMHKAPLRFEAASAKHLRDGQAAAVLMEDGKRIGTLGRLSDSIASDYKFRQPVYVCEVDLEALLNAKEEPAAYTPLARYPSSVRDASLLVNRRVTFAELLQTVKERNVANCRKTSLVDVYEGKGIPEDKRSITLRFEYRSDERTLKDEDVDAMHSQIINALNQKYEAEQRV
jgi:phenylalanyl-tRNA synthetase beta chain